MTETYSGLTTTKTDMAKVSQIYKNQNNLQKENSNIRTPLFKSTGERICNNCTKEDVCKYKEECMKAVKDILDIGKRKNVFIKTEINCSKWNGKPDVGIRW